MSWWQRLLGRGARGRKDRIRAKISGTRGRAARDPHRALASLTRLGRREAAVVGVGAPLHDEFRDALIAAWAAAEGAEPLRLAAATLVSWRRWRQPTTVRLVEWARREDHPVLAVVDDDGRAHHDAVLQLTALRVLAERPSVVMVTFDGIDLFARRSFLSHCSAGAGGGVPAGIVGALADNASAIGYEVVADPDRSD